MFVHYPGLTEDAKEMTAAMALSVTHMRGARAGGSAVSALASYLQEFAVVDRRMCII